MYGPIANRYRSFSYRRSQSRFPTGGFTGSLGVPQGCQITKPSFCFSLRYLGIVANTSAILVALERDPQTPDSRDAKTPILS